MDRGDRHTPHLPILVLLGGVTLVSAAGCAEDPPRPPGSPPPAALAACRGQPQAAPCQFEDQGHWITGTCQAKGPDWVCVPDRPPPGDRPPPQASPVAGERSAGTREPLRPPREAFDACLGQIEGAACEVKTPHGPVKGRCGRDPGGLACIPPQPGPPPQGTSSGTPR